MLAVTVLHVSNLLYWITLYTYYKFRLFIFFIKQVGRSIFFPLAPFTKEKFSRIYFWAACGMCWGICGNGSRKQIYLSFTIFSQYSRHPFLAILCQIFSNIWWSFEGSSFIILTRLRAGRPCWIPGTGGKWHFFSPPCTDGIRDSRSLLSNGHQGLLLQNKAAGTWTWSLSSIYCRG